MTEVYAQAMKRAPSALLLMLVCATPAPAQTAPVGPSHLPIEIRTGETPSTGPLGRTVAPPAPQDPAAIEQARRAAEALERAQRDREFLKTQTVPRPGRPDLGYDVTSGIQQRNLRGARP